MNQPTETCGNCRFCKDGACHFNPPFVRKPYNQAEAAKYGTVATWPSVKPDDWCGQWKAGEAKPRSDVAPHVQVITK